MDNHTQSLLPQSRRRQPLLPLIVGKYLQNTYPAVLTQYLSEASIQPTTLDDDSLPDLRTLVEEYETWVLSRQLESTNLRDDPNDQRPIEYASSASDLPLRELVKRPVRKEAVDTVLRSVRKTFDQIGTGGFLSVKWEKVAKREFDTGSASYRASYPHRIIVTSTDKTLKTIDPETGEVDHLLQPHKAAILSFAVHPVESRYIVTTSMDSTAILTDLITLEQLQVFRHSKFVVRCAFSPDGRWLATASYDRTIVIYEDSQWDYRQQGLSSADVSAEDEDGLDETDDPRLARDPTLRFEERHKIVLNHNPESMVFDPESRYLLYTTRASHLLYYVQLPSAAASLTTGETPTTTSSVSFPTYTKSFNPHPHDSHISFAVLNLVLDPAGRMIACQTGDHAGGTGERILLYDINLPKQSADTTSTTVSDPPPEHLTSRGASWLPSLSTSNTVPPENERLAVIWTGQEGDDYVLPRMAWLPDSSGIITTTTTGWLTMLSLKGETVARLKVHGGADGAGVGGRPAGQSASEVIRDVCVIGDKDDVHGWKVVSVGYDATVRIS